MRGINAGYEKKSLPDRAGMLPLSESLAKGVARRVMPFHKRDVTCLIATNAGRCTTTRARSAIPGMAGDSAWRNWACAGR